MKLATQPNGLIDLGNVSLADLLLPSPGNDDALSSAVRHVVNKVPDELPDSAFNSALPKPKA